MSDQARTFDIQDARRTLRSGSDLRAHLRERTAGTHATLDERLDALPLETPEGYGLFLKVVAAGLLPLEAYLKQHGIARILDDWPLRERTPAIREDLSRLAGGRTFSVDRSRLPLAPVLGHLWGALYVLEGSRLGGRVLRRRVPEGLPTAYLDHGRDAALWPSFLQRLKSAEADWEPMVAGAEAAFALFHEAADHATC